MYREHIYAQVNGLGSLPLVDDVYDVVMSSNGFAPGQIYPESIEEILRNQQFTIHQIKISNICVPSKLTVARRIEGRL